VAYSSRWSESGITIGEFRFKCAFSGWTTGTYRVPMKQIGNTDGRFTLNEPETFHVLVKKQ
jgi:hypothetical protein